MLYVNGDSYSADMANFKVYGHYLADKLSIPLINQASVGSCNDRIFRTTMEYIASLSDQEKPLIVIGFSFFTRDEVWLKNIDNYKNHIQDFDQSHFVSMAWLLQNKNIDAETKSLIVEQNINKQIINFYTKLYMLTKILKSLNLTYFIFSAAENEDYKDINWGSLNNLSMYRSVVQDPNVCDFQKFNIPSWARTNNITTTKTGHLLSDGHYKFADFLYNKIQQNL
ncbi:hypothetical protein UFOVP328_133 [uncultured Caudovirales phage]|uniref:Uncharacterized protein n=1 Tax=uncultured Caudovirales phage TaxID=2100421 RepID=A0A6J5LTY2_9CAUD|nr:hypothetical protein UFOVP328_133 [uncultured Caudovirales phage]